MSWQERAKALEDRYRLKAENLYNSDNPNFSGIYNTLMVVANDIKDFREKIDLVLPTAAEPLAELERSRDEYSQLLAECQTRVADLLLEADTWRARVDALERKVGRMKEITEAMSEGLSEMALANAELSNVNANARARVAELEVADHLMTQMYTRLNDEAQAMRARVTELEAALRPFAKFYQNGATYEMDELEDEFILVYRDEDTEDEWVFKMTVGDLRRARNLLEVTAEDVGS